MKEVADYEVSIADTETAWGVDAAMNEILLTIRAQLRADLRTGKLPVTYHVFIQRK